MGGMARKNVSAHLPIAQHISFVQSYGGFRMVRVLSCTLNDQLRSTRQTILSLAGCEVINSLSMDDALERMEREHFDVLLLGHSLSGSSMDRLCEAFRARFPQGQVVMVAGSNEPTCQADRVVFGLEGPEALVKAVLGDQDDLNKP
jgi:CheY-like chemotaxis protein